MAGGLTIAVADILKGCEEGFTIPVADTLKGCVDFCMSRFSGMTTLGIGMDGEIFEVTALLVGFFHSFKGELASLSFFVASLTAS